MSICASSRGFSWKFPAQWTPDFWDSWTRVCSVARFHHALKWEAGPGCFIYDEVSFLLWVNCVWFWGHHWLFSSEILIRALIRVVGRWYMHSTKYPLTVKCRHLNHKVTQRGGKSIGIVTFAVRWDQAKQEKSRRNISQALLLGFFRQVVVSDEGISMCLSWLGKGQLD